MTQNISQLEAAEQQKIVVLDDDRLSAHNLGIQLRSVGETPVFSTSHNWQRLFEMLNKNGEIDNVFAIALGVIKNHSVLDLLNALHSSYPDLPLLLLNNQEEIQYSLLPDSLQAKFMPLGDSSLNYRNLLVALQNARQMSGHAQLLRPSSIISETGTAMFRSLSGQSESMQRVRQLLLGVATKQVTALVLGESGTGKEIVARNLHYHSGRSEKPFIVVNCAAVSPDRYGVELFGQEKNFHGALESVAGLIEKADGGTLFFDDVAELPLNVQGMLLRFLEDKKFQRMGGHTTITSDARVVAATRYSLEEKIREGNFRQDLYYRLSVVPIEIPPLRNRIEDIPDLIKELLSRLENKEHSSIRFNSAAIESLQQHFWSGNVRELANLVERMCIIKPNEVIGVVDLPQEYQYASNGRRMHPPRIPDQRAQPSELVTNIPAQNLDPVYAQAPIQLALENPAQATQKANEVKANEAVVEQTQTAPMADAPQLQTNANASSYPGYEHQQGVVAVETDKQNAHGSPSGNAVTASNKIEENFAMLPLNAERLEQYLQNLERNLLEVAMLDSANIMKFAADRLKLDENTLREKLQSHGLTA